MKSRNLLGRDKIINILEGLLKSSEADLTAISFHHTICNVTRFANMRIHQNIQQLDYTISIKVVFDNRVGVATTSLLSMTDLKAALSKASDIAKVSPKKNSQIKISKPHDMLSPDTYFNQTANFTFKDKADMIKKIFGGVKKIKLQAAGSFLTGQEEMAVVDSAGLRRYKPSTVSNLKIIAINGESSGYASILSRNIDDICLSDIIGQASSRCRQFKTLHTIKPDRYDCILEPEAVGEIMAWLGYIGFGAKQFSEHTSFMCGRFSDKIMSGDVTICDDGLYPGTLMQPFDYEGTAKEKVVLVEKGIAKGLVYDNFYGSLFDKSSTGHAASFTDSGGPMPCNLIMEPGNSSMGAMLKGLNKGLLITRFNYVNGLLDTKDAVMTGLTRDGTYLVRNGKIKKALRNMRFTQNMLEAFSKIALISKDRKLTGDPLSSNDNALVPALLIKDFAFTGIAG